MPDKAPCKFGRCYSKMGILRKHRWMRALREWCKETDKKMKVNFTTIYRAILITALLWLIFVSAGARVLISEKRVEPGQIYFVAGYGDLGKADHASLVCRYFTGRHITTTVYWYSSNNVLGKDECPFFSLRD